VQDEQRLPAAPAQSVGHASTLPGPGPARNDAGSRTGVEFSLLRSPPVTGYRDRVRQPLRALAYVASGVPLGLVLVAAVPVLAVTGIGLALLGIPVGAVERHRLRLVDPRPAPSPHRAPSGRGWLSTRLREPATWQELAYAVLTAVVLWPLDVVAIAAVGVGAMTALAPLVVAVAPEALVPNGIRLAREGLIWLVPLLGVVLLVGSGYAVAGLARVRAGLARALLVPGPDGERLVELTRSRSRLVSRFDDERRRIERDLHDGVQQRLLALSVSLGLARLEPGPAAPLIAQAHDESKAILDELRRLVSGIHPWILTDRGLVAAFEELAARTVVPVRVDVALPGRFPREVESAAYFVVSEALANVDRHSGATEAGVTARYADGTVTIDVRDNGCGGADPSRGTGLVGLADRADAAGARLLVASPPGGPTLLRLEIPCAPTG
jgi:signal transduction histidine kinase